LPKEGNYAGANAQLGGDKFGFETGVEKKRSERRDGESKTDGAWDAEDHSMDVENHKPSVKRKIETIVLRNLTRRGT